MAHTAINFADNSAFEDAATERSRLTQISSDLAVASAQNTSHGAVSAGATYGSNEQNMLNDVYAALRANGLLA